MKRMLLLLIATLLLISSFFACDKDKASLPDNPHTYDEYCVYLENYAPFPTWFIYYKDISFVGEFGSFEEIEMKDKPFCADVVYALSDAFGGFKLQCIHWYLYKEDFVPYEGVKYEKENERVSAITWVYKGTEFVFFDLENYPENAKDTFMSRLLNPDTVDAAVAKFNLRVKGY